VQTSSSSSSLSSFCSLTRFMIISLVISCCSSSLGLVQLRQKLFMHYLQFTLYNAEPRLIGIVLYIQVVQKLAPKILEDIPSTNNMTKMYYGKVPFNTQVLSKTFLNFRNVATSGLVTVHKYGLSVPRM
jgi:hypothetical protein